MSSKSLSNLSSEATELTNTAGVTTPILEIDPDDGTLIRIKNMVQSGSGEGLPIFADLRDGSDNQLPTSTELVFRVLRPTDDEPVAVSVKEDNISAFNQLTISEQRDSDNIDSVKIELKGEVINIRDKDTLRVELNSSSQIDWTNSEFYFYRQGVESLPFEG